MNNVRGVSLKSILAVGVLAGLSVSASEAASVYLSPASQSNTYNPAALPSENTLSVALWMDFTNEPTVGGGIDLDFQGDISMGVFTPTSYFTNTADPGFTGHGAADADNDYEVHFGNFAGLSGVNKLGDISINLLGPGAGSISLAINSLYGGFFGTNFLSMDVDLSGGAEITASAVPAPAGVWLLLTGLAGLVTRRFTSRS
jgi:hypothetical protein